METSILYRSNIGVIWGQWKIKWKLLYYIGTLLGLEWESNGKITENKMDTSILYRGYIGIMENKIGATILYRDYIGVLLENKMKTTTLNHKPYTLNPKP